MKNLCKWKVLFIAFTSFICSAEQVPNIRFLDEYVIEAGKEFSGTTIGGLSSIDFVDGTYYLISDHGGGKRESIKGSPRYYRADIQLGDNKIQQVDFKSVVRLQSKEANVNGIDPESLRVLPGSKTLLWSSEGSVKQGKAPSVMLSTIKGDVLETQTTFELPKHFSMGQEQGPFHNAVFEGLSLDVSDKGFWVAMEGPLKQDGEESTLTQGSLIRVSYFSFDTKKVERQFAYYLEPIPHEPQAKIDAFRTTGVVEILQTSQDKFIVMERAYTAGLKDGGNRVSLYLVDASQASDTSKLNSLEQQSIVPAVKKKWLDLKSVQSLLPSKRIDNLEGLSFGPRLANGNQSLLLVSDDNFNQFGAQVSQILLFEVEGLK